MHPVKGPRQPVTLNPNGKLDYTFNPMENLPVEECAPWLNSMIDDSTVATNKTEHVFSSQTVSEFLHENTNT